MYIHLCVCVIRLHYALKHKIHAWSCSHIKATRYAENKFTLGGTYL